MEQVQQELIRSNEMLATQVWILGGLISFLLLVLIGLAKGAWSDVRKTIEDHENRLTDLETFKNQKEQMIEDHDQHIDKHRELIGRLEVSISKITK